MTTGTLGTAARQDPRQVVNTLKMTINYNSAASGTAIAFDNPLPKGAFITRVLAEIVTVFNAGTTNVLVVGTNASSYNNIANAGDINEAATGVYEATRGLGRSLAAAADTTVYAMFTQTGAAATTGQAVIVIEYEGGWTT